MRGLLFINYPSWIHPEIFPGIPLLGLLRWYGLMYIFAFGTAFWILQKERKEGALDSGGKCATEDEIFSFITFGIVCLLIGARIFSTLIYDTSRFYWKKPWLIFWPFDTATKQFTGLAGMSYHGGFLGGLAGTVIWCRIHKKPVLKWMDAMVVAIPLGYTFGRLGNFLNGELYGRITTVPWGMIFPRAERFSSSLEWVQHFAEKIGLDTDGAKLVNLPRHPSQIYESLFEGVFLFAVLWNFRRRKKFDGFLTGVYTAGYGLVRFFIEYFREPDADIGYRISSEGAAIYTNSSLLNISTGQIFCFAMIILGAAEILILFLLNRKRQKNDAA
jgi:phosphatidylglycerol:prolipoprotein diacylglycerol transferase